MKKIPNTAIKIVICLAVSTVVAGSAILPGYILDKQTETQYNIVTEVPTEYYSGPSEAVVKNASKQLSDLQKLQLISGLWDSEISEASDSETNISELEAKELAISKLILLSEGGLYPINVDSDYQKWYSWTASSYKAVDTTFRTYSAIYWDVTFTKYDNSESHRIVITENGDVLFAEAVSNTDTKSFGDFSPKLNNIGYLFADAGSDIANCNSTVDSIASSSGSKDITSNNTFSDNNNQTDNHTPDQSEVMLSSAESYLGSLPHFDITGAARFNVTEDNSLIGEFIYGNENKNYTFVLTLFENHN